MPNFTNLPERHFVDKAKRLSLGDKDSDVYFDGEALEALINTVEDLQEPVTTDRIADGAVTAAKLSIPKYNCTMDLFELENFESENVAVFDTSEEAHTFIAKQEAENAFIEIYDPDSYMLPVDCILSRGGTNNAYSGILYYNLASKILAIFGQYLVIVSGGKHNVRFTGQVRTIYED